MWLDCWTQSKLKLQGGTITITTLKLVPNGIVHNKTSTISSYQWLRAIPCHCPICSCHSSHQLHKRLSHTVFYGLWSCGLGISFNRMCITLQSTQLTMVMEWYLCNNNNNKCWNLPFLTFAAGKLDIYNFTQSIFTVCRFCINTLIKNQESILKFSLHFPAWHIFFIPR